MDIRVVQTTVATESDAGRLAGGALEKHLAGCVQEMRVVSRYRWEGRLEQEAEILLVFKTTEDRSETLVAWLQQNHPYEVPEILLLPVEAIGAYGPWLAAEVAPDCAGGDGDG